MAEPKNKNRRKATGDLRSEGLISIRTVEVPNEDKKWFQFWKPDISYKIDRTVIGPLVGPRDTTITDNLGNYSSSYRLRAGEGKLRRMENFEELNRKFEDLYDNAGYEYKWPGFVPVEKKGAKIVKDQDPAGPIKFGQFLYTGNKYINTKGDTVAVYGGLVRPDEPYEIIYTNKKDGDGVAKLTTKAESGNAQSGKEVQVSRTSDWGKEIDAAFYEPSRKLEIREDYSKKPWYSKWFYKMFGYKKGGLLMRQGGRIVEVPFN